GLERLRELIESEGAELVVVGLPLTLRGERGAQAEESEAFAGRLRERLAIPVETYDERFTSVLADGDDARAAAHLLTTYLEWARGRS
ncbi:MAG: Holliday junction resolvase RuvX, partial [Candidatus Rokuibacteriota bacterium]